MLTHSEQPTRADQLILRARGGERLSAPDRRHCVSVLQATDPDMYNVEMGKLFGVGERAIRKDILNIREERAKLIRQDDIGLVIADIALTFDRQVQDLQRSKQKSGMGSRTYLEHCKAIARMQIDRVELLQNLGFYPKNLGNMTVDKFVYKAIVTKDGSVDTRKADVQFDDALDATFEDMPLLPAPSVEQPTEQPQDKPLCLE